MANEQEDGIDHLDQALRLEQDVLSQMRALIAQLPEADPYREVLERHRHHLEEAVEQIGALVEGAPSRGSRRS